MSTTSMAASPSHNLLAEVQYLKAKLKRNEGITNIARDRALRVEELEAEIQELMERSSVRDLDSAVARLRSTHKAEIGRLNTEHKAEVEKVDEGWKKIVKDLQGEITRLEGKGEEWEKVQGDVGKVRELRQELHDGGNRLSEIGYRYVKVGTYLKVKEELQAEIKGREEAEVRLKEAQEENAQLRDRAAANKLVMRGPASNSPGLIREVVREAVGGMRGRSRGSRE